MDPSSSLSSSRRFLHLTLCPLSPGAWSHTRSHDSWMLNRLSKDWVAWSKEWEQKTKRLSLVPDESGAELTVGRGTGMPNAFWPQAVGSKRDSLSWPPTLCWALGVLDIWRDSPNNPVGQGVIISNLQRRKLLCPLYYSWWEVELISNFGLSWDLVPSSLSKDTFGYGCALL